MLDDKLREILDELWPLPDWHSDDPNEMADYQEREVTKAKAAIKQAFSEAGYVQPLEGGYVFSDAAGNFTKATGGVIGEVEGTEIYSINGDSNIMTGQEWYDRFEMELANLMESWNPNGEGCLQRSHVLEAAKKAAGIDEKA